MTEIRYWFNIQLMMVCESNYPDYPQTDIEGDPMSNNLLFPLLLLTGLIGYFLFCKLHISAAALIGSMMMVMITTALGVPWPEMPGILRSLFQILIGIMIGCRFTADTPRLFRTWLMPAALMSGWMFLTGLINGVILLMITPFEAGTALLSATPGGLAEMTILAFSYNLDVPKVAFFHTLRVFLVHLLIPPAITLLQHKKSVGTDDVVSRGRIQRPLNSVISFQWIDVSVTRSLLIGLAGGWLGTRMGMPAGEMLGALFAIGLVRIMNYEVPSPPRQLITFAQIGMGITIGLTFQQSFFGYMGELLIPLLLITALQFLSGFALAMVVHKLFHWDLITALFSCSPAGLSQMSVIALELEADPIRVSLMHLTRLVTLVTLIPLVLPIIMHFFGS